MDVIEPPTSSPAFTVRGPVTPLGTLGAKMRVAVTAIDDGSSSAVAIECSPVINSEVAADLTTSFLTTLATTIAATPSDADGTAILTRLAHDNQVVPAAPAVPTNPTQSEDRIPLLMSLAGIVVVLVGVFLPLWDAGSVSAFTSITGNSLIQSGYGWITLGALAWAAYQIARAFQGRPQSPWGDIVSGVWIIGSVAYTATSAEQMTLCPAGRDLDHRARVSACRPGPRNLRDGSRRSATARSGLATAQRTQRSDRHPTLAPRASSRVPALQGTDETRRFGLPSLSA